MNENIEREKVINIAKSWLNTPYITGGRIKGVGADCLTVLAGIYEEAGLVDHVSIPNYSHDFHLHKSEQLYMNGLLKYMEETKTPKPADIVLWQFGRCFSHGAIIVEWPIVIHAYVKSRCITENVDRAIWLKYLKDGKTLRPVRFFTYWRE